MERLVAPERIGIEIARATCLVRQMESESPVQAQGDEAQVVAKAYARIQGKVVAQPAGSNVSMIQRRKEPYNFVYCFIIQLGGIRFRNFSRFDIIKVSKGIIASW